MSYKSINDAAVAALRAIVPKSFSENAEYGGVVYSRPDGTFEASKAVTQHNPHAVSLGELFGFDIDGSKGIPLSEYVRRMRERSIVASWHTHPTDREYGRVFSPDDIALSFGQEAFMASRYTGKIHKVTDEMRSLLPVLEMVRALHMEPPEVAVGPEVAEIFP